MLQHLSGIAIEYEEKEEGRGGGKGPERENVKNGGKREEGRKKKRGGKKHIHGESSLQSST